MRYKWTLIGLILAVALWAVTIILNLDLFGAFTDCLQRHEALEIDELLFPAALFYIFLMADMARRHQNCRIEVEKSKVYRSTLRAMNHIVNNFLQKMLLFKLTAENSKDFDPEVLKQYDVIITEANAQIRALECITEPSEDAILDAINDPAARS